MTPTELKARHQKIRPKQNKTKPQRLTIDLDVGITSEDNNKNWAICYPKQIRPSSIYSALKGRKVQDTSKQLKKHFTT